MYIENTLWNRVRTTKANSSPVTRRKRTWGKMQLKSDHELSCVDSFQQKHLLKKTNMASTQNKMVVNARFEQPTIKLFEMYMLHTVGLCLINCMYIYSLSKNKTQLNTNTHYDVINN